MPDFLFDGPNKLIIEPAGAGDTSFDVGRDVYSAWKRWVESGSGAGFINAFQVEGGTPIGATGLFTGSTILLVNGWKIQAANHDHQLTLVGNLFSDDGVVSVPPATASATVFVSATVGAQGITSGSGLDATQQAQLAEIWRILGLDAANPMTVTPTQRTAGAIDQTISGDGETTTTVTRQ